MILNVQEKPTPLIVQEKICNSFGIVVKTVKLKSEDSAISSAVRDYVIQKMKTAEGKPMNWAFLEFHVHCKYRGYRMPQGIKVDYDVAIMFLNSKLI